MSSSSNINIVLSQSTAIKEIHNVTKQSLELNQQYVTQHAEIRKKEDKEKVVESNAGSHVEIGNENERSKMARQNREQTDSSEDTDENESMPSGDHIIDITV
ncbi:hypothetical protein [Desulfobacterium sp. N47]|uniref:Uncharacterized protein n=1 Tax=uncultured Desulfobacterium sp. TaxID=201089 RepID=E1YHM1_9BACT|nr:unknown protein [uncultured Desulfobacterium sp.]